MNPRKTILVLFVAFHIAIAFASVPIDVIAVLVILYLVVIATLYFTACVMDNKWINPLPVLKKWFK